MLLPKDKTPASRSNPKKLLIFGKPKIGKTTLLSQLEDCLIVDLEGGTEYVEALKVSVNTLPQYGEFIKALKEAYINNGNKAPYKYIAIDTISKLEDLAREYAIKLYMDSPMGKSFDASKYGNDITNLPQGSGYNWFREAFAKLLDMIVPYTDHLILVGHTKDISLDKDNVSLVDLDLTGKMKRIICSQMDAIGFLKRKKDKTLISFKSGDDVLQGSRLERLNNREFEILEFIEGKPVSYWDQIFQ